MKKGKVQDTLQTMVKNTPQKPTLPKPNSGLWPVTLFEDPRNGTARCKGDAPLRGPRCQLKGDWKF